MTKEQAIEKAKEQYSEIWNCDINHPKYEDTVEEIVTGVIRLIMHSPTDDCVSLEVFKQVMWERDIAIEQLKELGYEFGEKIRTSDDCVSRQAMLDAITEIDDNINMDIYTNEVREIINELSPVTSTHGTCENCRYNKKARTIPTMCDKGHRFELRDPSTFYCADFKKRGDENDSN